MATTTNYGWDTPDDTDLVKDGAAAIRTLGSSVDTTTKALNPSTTLGDIEYRSATANTNTRLGIGTTGQVLTVSGGVPSWSTAASGSMTTLASGSLSGALSLTSISGSYKDLVLVLRGVAVSNDDVNLRLNADTGSNYAWVQIAANLTSPGRTTSDTKIQLTQPFVATGNTSNMIYIRINDYTNTSSFKSVTASTAGNPDGGKSAVWTTGMFASTSAITGISTSTSFTGGTYILYGVN